MPQDWHAGDNVTATDLQGIYNQGTHLTTWDTTVDNLAGTERHALVLADYENGHKTIVTDPNAIARDYQGSANRTMLSTMMQALGAKTVTELDKPELGKVWKDVTVAYANNPKMTLGQVRQLTLQELQNRGLVH